MKRICALLLTAALLTGSAAAAGETAAQPALDLSAASAVLMEKETGTLLYEKASHEKLEPASVTKVMTLLLIFEALDSGRVAKEDVVTVSAYAAGMGGSQVYLKEGEQMTVGELVKCITVVSGNDAAVAMAEYLAGSETAFVEQMNRRAQELGMGDTTFLNCTGLPAQGHVTSAHDIALMSRELVLNHPGIREYTTIWMDSIRNGAFGLTNTNRLVRFYQGATGLKTGSTDSALYCMSATAERDGMELIAVVMKSPTSADRFEDAKALLDYGFASYTLVSVYPDSPLAPIPVLLGEHPPWPPSRCCWASRDRSSPSWRGSAACWSGRARRDRSPPRSPWPRIWPPRWNRGRPWERWRSLWTARCGTPSPSSPPRGWNGSQFPRFSPGFWKRCSWLDKSK